MASRAEQYYCSAEKWYGPTSYDNNNRSLDSLMPVGRPEGTLHLFMWQQFRLLQHFENKLGRAADELDFVELLADPASNPQLLDLIWPWQNNLHRNDTDIATMTAVLRRWAKNTANTFAAQVADGVFRRNALKYLDPCDLVPVPQTPHPPARSQLSPANAGHGQLQPARQPSPSHPPARNQLHPSDDGDGQLQPAQHPSLSHPPARNQLHSTTDGDGEFVHVKTERNHQHILQTEQYPTRQAPYQPYRPYSSLSQATAEDEPGSTYSQTHLEDGVRTSCHTLPQSPATLGIQSTNSPDSAAPVAAPPRHVTTGPLRQAEPQQGQRASDGHRDHRSTSNNPGPVGHTSEPTPSQLLAGGYNESAMPSTLESPLVRGSFAHSQGIPGAFPSAPVAGSQASTQHPLYAARPVPTLARGHSHALSCQRSSSTPPLPRSNSFLPSTTSRGPRHPSQGSTSYPQPLMMPSLSGIHQPTQSTQPTLAFSQGLQYSSPRPTLHPQAPRMVPHAATPHQANQSTQPTSATSQSSQYPPPDPNRYQQRSLHPSARYPQLAQLNLEEQLYRQNPRPQQVRAMQRRHPDQDTFDDLGRAFQDFNI